MIGSEGIKLSVAIIGAGLSGLTCAIVLKRNGIYPTVFEKKNHIGEVLDLPAIQLRMFQSKLKDPLNDLRDKYDINLNRHYELKEIISVTPSNSYTARGKLGYIFLRGREEGYLTMQLKNAAALSCNFSTLADPNDIKKDFDHVVVATGNLDVPMKMNLVTTHFDSYVRIANILGDFSVNTIKVWFNTRYAKHGYAYLVPISSKEARLVLIVDNIKPKELDYYWEEFISYEKISYPIVETKDIRHLIGLVSPVQVGNLYFIGNAGGFIDSLLGFGSVKSMFSGAVAANCIINGLDYNKKMQPLIKDICMKYEFRKVYNTFDNAAIDRFVAIEHLPLVRQFIFNNPLLRVRQGAFLAKAYNSLIKK